MNNLLLLLLVTLPADAGVWPGFRGDGNGHSAAKDLPLKWSPTEGIAWKADLPGYGQSSPVIWKQTAFVTAVEGEEKETLLVMAYDIASGKQAWKKRFKASQKGKNSSFTSRAAPTPIVDATGLYTLFASGDLIKLDHDGKVVWQRSLTKDFGKFENNHGLGSSPAQTEKAIIVLVDHGGPSYLLAVDKKTGRDLWKTARDTKGSWSSPIATKFDGKPIVIVSSAGSAACYDGESG